MSIYGRIDDGPKWENCDICVMQVRMDVPDFPLAEYMPVERAVFILNDLTYGQLDNFTPRAFVDYPYPAAQLAGAAFTLCWAITERGFTDWTNDSLIAMWLVAGAVKDLRKSVPKATAHIISHLNGEPEPELHRVSNHRNQHRNPGRKATAGYVYVLRSPTGAYKIGYTINPANRIRTFSVKLPFEVEYEVLIKTDDMRDLEAFLHDRYAERTINGEWFALTDDDLAELRAMGGAK